MNDSPWLWLLSFLWCWVESTPLRIFQRSFFQEESSPILDPSFLHPLSSIMESQSLSWMFALLGDSPLPFLLYFPWTFFYGGLEEVGWRWFYKNIFVGTLYLKWCFFPLSGSSGISLLSTPLDYSRFVQLSHLFTWWFLGNTFRLERSRSTLERSCSLYPRSYADW